VSGDLEDRFTIELEQQDGFEFLVRFDLDDVPDLLVDEPEPLGHGGGPNPSRLLAVSVANCLSASLLFCLQKSKVEGVRVRTTASGQLVRNESKRLRIGGVDVKIRVSGIGEEDEGRLERCLGLFEDYCVVTASVKDGIPVNVEVVRE
jgi:uncharacterized OsmC-like protein